MKYILIIISLIALTSCESLTNPGGCKFKFRSVSSNQVYLSYTDCDYQVGDTVLLFIVPGEWVIIKAY